MSARPDPTVHVVGAGLAGLSAAVRLTGCGQPVILYEAAGHAGGRCRSFDDATLGCRIDNGNHLVLAGNSSTIAYLEAIGARGEVADGVAPAFPFYDLASDERWTLRPGPGRMPWWIFDKSRRVLGASVFDHVRAARLARVAPTATVSDVVGTSGTMVERFWEPLTIAVLNTIPQRASARLLSRVLADTFGRGGEALRPVLFRQGLSAAFVDPALNRLREGGATVRFHHRLRHVQIEGGRVTALEFGETRVALASSDTVILAVPPGRLRQLLPFTDPPKDETVIVNAHFRLDDRERALVPPMTFLGLVNARTHWIFVRPGLVSTTISAAQDLGLATVDADVLLDTVWREVRQALALPGGSLPAARRLIREKRATFDQSPAGVAKRPSMVTPLANLLLAGDVVDTGLPATIEGAIRSGEAAAQRCLALKSSAKPITVASGVRRAA